jgi:FkbM family methyltransferase
MYSQSEEEKYILEACKDVEPKRFLDIGSFHPLHNSNTRALYEAGWSGVMIEPQPMMQSGGDNSLTAGMCSLVEYYNRDPRITLIQAAVGTEAGLRPFALDGQTSTLKTTTSNFYVPCITLDQLFQQFGAGFGFVSIDAEGISVELALRLIQLTREIPCVCVEYDLVTGSDSPGFVSKDLLIRYTMADYAVVYSSQENAVFRKKTWEEMHP